MHSEPADKIRKDVLLIADDIHERGGVRTRVLGELSAVDNRLEVRMLVKTRLRNLARIGETKAELKATFPKVKVTFVPLLPHHDILLVREFAAVANVMLLTLAGLMACASWRPSSIYSHNLECSLAGMIIGGVLRRPSTTDLHGDEVEETVAINRWRMDGFRHRVWRRVLGNLVRRSTFVVCVSRQHENYIEQVHRRSAPSIVIPCCIDASDFRLGTDESLEEIDIRLGPHEYTLVYSGSVYHYQMLDQMAKVFTRLRFEGEPCAFMLLISDPRALDEVRSKFAKEDRPFVHVASLERSRAIAASARGNIGLLFREPTIFNTISSPTKFAEYLCAGIPVLMTEGVGDYSGIVLKERIGGTIDLSRIEESGYVSSVLRALRKELPSRDHCREFAFHNLTWGLYADSLVDAFLARSGPPTTSTDPRRV